MKIAIAQMRVLSAQLEQNFENIKIQIEKAKREQAELIIFPEMCVSGQLLGDKYFDDSFCQEVHNYSDKIKTLSDGIGIIFGNLYYQFDNGVKRANCAFFAYQQQWVHRIDKQAHTLHVKTHTTNTRIYDEARYFTPMSTSLNNKNSSCFHFETGDCSYRIQLTIGDELFSDSISFQEVDYIINIACDPYHIDVNRQTQIDALIDTKGPFMAPLVYVNTCGIQNTGKNIVVYAGDSSVYNKNGQRIFTVGKPFEEGITIFNEANISSHSVIEPTLFDTLVYTIKEVDMQLFNSKVKWIIGLSGGIDSCINACLLTKALGSHRVVGYNMASAYNSLTTKNNARQLADALGIEIREGSIESLHQATLDTLHMYGYKDEYPSLVYENIQARIRGHLLSTFASVEGGVVINNGNKIEVALGYCTLYGDCIGAFSPLGDLTKVQCFEVAKQCNKAFSKEVISTSLIPELKDNKIHWDMPPSAELKNAQLDPMKWYYHDQLIDIILKNATLGIEHVMQSYLDDSILNSDLGKWIHYYHLNDAKTFLDDLEWLFKTMQNATFKRIQMPPVLLLSEKGYGSDYREVQLGFIKTKRYEQLKEEILKKKA